MRLSRPTPALVVAVVALFVAMGGTGYAALQVTGKNVKNGTLSGKDVKKNSLTGRQIAESKLAKVPKAKLADGATNAAKLAGHEAKCPTFTRLVRGKCWDLQVQPKKSVFAAESACAQRGGTLPGVLELREFGLQADVDLGAIANDTNHLSADVFTDNLNNVKVMAAAEGGAVRSFDGSETRPYRCVFPLVS